jgi:hypothetical protein
MPMPKNSLDDILPRWIALDAALATEKGVRVSKFAREHGVSLNTVHRDMQVFTGAGYQIVGGFYAGETVHPRNWSWRYEAGIRPMFAVNAAPPTSNRSRLRSNR